MKIVEVNTYTVRPRWGFVEIVTDEGLTGWGEPVLEGHCATVLACVQEMKPYLIGKDPMRIEDFSAVLYRAGFYRGGGVLMNAGAYGAELSQVVAQVEGIHLADGRRVSYPADRLNFSYRHSALMDTDVVVTQATLALAPGDPEAIRARMEACARARREKQPLNLPSAGSTFKRPEGHFAAKLIDDCGLRGLTVGGAQVSEKHAGFVVNVGGATARDMLELMRQIEQRVFEQTGVQLEPEVRILGADEQKKEESV